METLIGRQHQITLNTGGDPATSQALLWLPVDYDTSNKTYPLIISLPGTGEQGNDINLLLHSGQMAKRIADGFSPDFIVCTPQGPANSWGWNRPHISNFIDQLINQYRVNNGAVFLTGLSAGAWGIQQAFTDANIAKKVAAMALVSSGSTVNDGCKVIANNNISCWIICGSADAHIVDANSEKAIIKQALFTSIPGVGHSAWYQAYDPNWKDAASGNKNLYDWFLSTVESTQPEPEPDPQPAPVVIEPVSISLSIKMSDGSVIEKTDILL